MLPRNSSEEAAVVAIAAGLESSLDSSSVVVGVVDDSAGCVCVCRYRVRVCVGCGGSRIDGRITVPNNDVVGSRR